MKNMIRRLREWMIEYAYLVTLGAVIAVIVGSAVYTHKLRGAQQAAAPAPEIWSSATPEPAASATPLPTVKPIQARFVVLPSGNWPVEGDVLRPFDAQTLVWWESIGAWQAHTGLDIAGEAGQSVKAAAGGEVVSSGYDTLWGWRVAIQQEDGHLLTYAGLENSFVSAGEHVARGQEIGMLMASIPVEGEMDAHLHLTSERNGMPQDPEAVLSER